MRRARDERGAVALVTALVTSFVLIAVAAIAVDIGVQRVARRDMQSLADVVAMDLSRELNGRDVATLTPLMPGLAQASRTRNAGTIGDVPTLDVTLGSVSTSGVFTPMASGIPTAVRVTAATSVDFAFGVAASGSVRRTAVSSAQAGSCLKVGSFLATVNTAQSALLNPLLGGLLGTTLNLSAVSYTGLAGSDVTLAQLVAVGGLGVGTPDELLALRGVSVRELFLASARVLDSQGKAAEAAVLRSINVSASTPTINIADLISAAPGDSSALAAGFNVLSLVQGAAYLSRQGSAVSVPGLALGIPGLAGTTASLNVIQAPQIKCGPVGMQVSTAQVSLTTTTRIAARTLAVPALGTSVTIDAFDVTLAFDLGKAIATLTAVNCAAGGVTSLAVALQSAVVGNIDLTAFSRVRARFSPLSTGSLLGDLLRALGLSSLLDLLSIPTLVLDSELRLAGGTRASTFSKDLTLPIPGAYTTPVGSGSGALVGSVYLNPTLNTTLSVEYQRLFQSPRTQVILNTSPLFDDVLGPIVNGVLGSVVNPLVSTLQNAVLLPLTQLLGVQYGGADVWAVPTASCSNPRLVG